jgi:hypothetical protein
MLRNEFIRTHKLDFIELTGEVEYKDGVNQDINGLADLREAQWRTGRFLGLGIWEPLCELSEICLVE